MATFSKCPRCGNKEDGAGIWACKDCGCVHCKECDPDDGTCPNCGGHVKSIGYIDND